MRKYVWDTHKFMKQKKKYCEVKVAKERAK